jgi:1,2-dihydroxy-3-keto-5-methylthiopentene dioxygenase
MALVRIPERQQTIDEREAVSTFLATYGITYERWEGKRNVPADATAEAVLQIYGDKIDELKARGGYTTADVIDVTPATPNLDAMLAKFSIEHWHDEDEVRFILEGRGIFHIHPRQGPTLAIEVGPGDLLRVPKGTWHWFDLCADRRIRAIRLFQDPSGWTPHYTDSGEEKKLEPVCLGPKQLAGAR